MAQPGPNLSGQKADGAPGNLRDGYFIGVAQDGLEIPEYFAFGEDGEGAFVKDVEPIL